MNKNIIAKEYHKREFKSRSDEDLFQQKVDINPK